MDKIIDTDVYKRQEQADLNQSGSTGEPSGLGEQEENSSVRLLNQQNKGSVGASSDGFYKIFAPGLPPK